MDWADAAVVVSAATMPTRSGKRFMEVIPSFALNLRSNREPMKLLTVRSARR
jgi:hypothetical protein